MKTRILLLNLTLLAISASLASAVPSLAPPVRNITGIYDCIGKGPDGHEYRGKVTIQKEDEIYRVSWQVGPESYDGIGIWNEGAFAVSFSGHAMHGIVIYQIDPSEDVLTLEGKWAVSVFKTVQTETLTKIRS